MFLCLINLGEWYRYLLTNWRRLNLWYWCACVHCNSYHVQPLAAVHWLLIPYNFSDIANLILSSRLMILPCHVQLCAICICFPWDLHRMSFMRENLMITRLHTVWFAKTWRNPITYDMHYRYITLLPTVCNQCYPIPFLFSNKDRNQASQLWLQCYPFPSALPLTEPKLPNTLPGLVSDVSALTSTHSPLCAGTARDCIMGDELEC